MPLMRIGYDDNIGQTFGNLANAFSAGWDPKTRAEAYLLQQHLWNEQLAYQTAQIQLQNERRKQATLLQVEQTYRGKVSPADYPIIQQMVEAGNSQDEIASKIAELNHDTSYMSPADRSAFNKAHAEDQRRASIIGDPVNGFWDYPSANPTDAQVLAVDRHNAGVRATLGDPPLPAGSIGGEGPNAREYGTNVAATQEFRKGRAGTLGAGLKPGETLLPEGVDPTNPATWPKASAAAPLSGPAPAAAEGGGDNVTLPGGVSIPKSVLGRPVAGPSPTQPGPLAPASETIFTPGPYGAVTLADPQAKATGKESMGNIKDISDAITEGRKAKLVQSKISQIGALAAVTQAEGESGVLSQEAVAKLEKAGLPGITMAQQASDTMNALGRDVARDSPAIAALTANGRLLSSYSRPSLFPILANAQEEAQDQWDRGQDAAAVSARKMDVDTFNENDAARSSTHNDRVGSTLTSYSAGIPQLIKTSPPPPPPRDIPPSAEPPLPAQEPTPKPAPTPVPAPTQQGPEGGAGPPPAAAPPAAAPAISAAPGFWEILQSYLAGGTPLAAAPPAPPATTPAPVERAPDQAIGPDGRPAFLGSR